jgi:hypothetical protein
MLHVVNILLYILNTCYELSMHYYVFFLNTYLHVNICGPHIVTTKNTSKTQEKPNPNWLFQSTN